MTNSERLKAIDKIEHIIFRYRDGQPIDIIALLLSCVAVLIVINILSLFSLPEYSGFVVSLIIGPMIFYWFSKYSKWPLSNEDQLAQAITAYQPLDLDGYKNIQELTAERKYLPLDEIRLFLHLERSVINDHEFVMPKHLEQFINKNDTPTDAEPTQNGSDN